MSVPVFLRDQADGTLLSVKVQPRASKNEFAGELGGELRVKVTAPPVDAAANEALIKLLADKLDWPRSRIELVRGHKSRHKVLKLAGLRAEDAAARLELK